jgi:SAM-dependent methyltransferase
LDDLIDRHRLAGPFFEAGCGQGFTAAHLARRGWEGTVIDVSVESCRAARKRLAGFPRIAIEQGMLESYRSDSSFATVLLFDLLEHIVDDTVALRAAARLQVAGGALLVVTPTHMREWRWDDDVYGHVRRYDPTALANLLVQSGYDVTEMRDLTFPVLWALRRGYTALKRPQAARGIAEVRNDVCSLARAWDMGVVSDAIARFAPWRLLFGIQRRFRHRFDLGHELIVLARRRGD